jgi:hypothetical protein
MIDWADRDFGGPQPPQEIIDKWERAVKENDPFILTTEDHLRMLRRWPLDEANRFCRHYVGLTIDQLVQKAADTTDLSEAEAIIVLNTPFGDSTPDEQKEMTNQGRWSRNTRKKFHDALDLIISRVETEKKARENAGVTLEKIKSIRKPELQNFTRDDLRNITGCNKIPWVRELEKHLEHEPAWGFVCLRTTFGDDLAWNRFKEFLIHATESALVFPRNFSSIRSRWKIQWIEDPSVQDLSVIELCR